MMEAGGEGDADIVAVADLTEQIAAQAPSTLSDGRAVAGAACALTVKDEAGAPEGRSDLSIMLTAHLIECLGRPVAEAQHAA